MNREGDRREPVPSCQTCLRPAADCAPPTRSSTRVPNAPQPGQRPSHRPETVPHSLHACWTAAAFATRPRYAVVPTANATTTGAGSISLSAAGTAYTQDFDSLVNTGTSGLLPAGWYFDETGTNSNALYTAGTGSANSGDTYSFGASGSNERAFGTLLSGSLTPVIGAKFTNNTGLTITSMDVSYTGEQWRLGTANRTSTLSG